jgi:Ca2+-binding EF-hand superfamily protein
MEQLWHVYRKIEQTEHGIDLSHFQKAFDIKDANFAKQLFKAFDTEGNGYLSYVELLHGLSAIHVDAKKEEKIKCKYIPCF